MDNADTIIFLLICCMAVGWAGYVLGWARGYREASDAAIKNIPATMALGFLVGRLHAEKKVDA